MNICSYWTRCLSQRKQSRQTDVNESAETDGKARKFAVVQLRHERCVYGNTPYKSQVMLHEGSRAFRFEVWSSHCRRMQRLNVKLVTEDSCMNNNGSNNELTMSFSPDTDKKIMMRWENERREAMKERAQRRERKCPQEKTKRHQAASSKRTSKSRTKGARKADRALGVSDTLTTMSSAHGHLTVSAPTGTIAASAPHE